MPARTIRISTQEGAFVRAIDAVPAVRLAATLAYWESRGYRCRIVRPVVQRADLPAADLSVQRPHFNGHAKVHGIGSDGRTGAKSTGRVFDPDLGRYRPV